MHHTRFAILLLIAGLVLHCKAGIDLGSTSGDAASSGSASGSGSGAGDDASAGSSGGGSDASAGSTAGSSDSGVTDASPPPNGCGGVCSGVTLPSTPVTALSQLAGIWSMCSGQVDVISPLNGGFPADTAGMEIEGSTAYLLVPAPGGLTRGAGLEYVWSLSLNSPVSSSGAVVVNFSNNYSNGLIGYIVTLIPAADGCAPAMHLVSDEFLHQSDYLAIAALVDGGSASSADASANGCGGVCSGVTEPNSALTSVSQLAGNWSVCAGQLVVMSAGSGGFPPDTVGMDIENGTAYLLVNGAAGPVRGQGLQYVWPVSLGYDDAATTAGLTFNNSYTNGSVFYTATYVPAADGCNSALHLSAAYPAYQPDLLGVGH